MAGCSSSPPPHPSHVEVPAGEITSATVSGATLVATLSGGSTVSAPADAASGPAMVVAGGGAVLVQVGEGATTTLYGLWAQASGRLVRVVAPVGEPGGGQPWQIPVGAGVETASGVICQGGDLVVVHRDGDAVTQHPYSLSGGVASATSTRSPAPSPDQVGALDC